MKGLLQIYEEINRLQTEGQLDRVQHGLAMKMAALGDDIELAIKTTDRELMLIFTLDDKTTLALRARNQK